MLTRKQKWSQRSFAMKSKTVWYNQVSFFVYMGGLTFAGHVALVVRIIWNCTNKAFVRCVWMNSERDRSSVSARFENDGWASLTMVDFSLLEEVETSSSNNNEMSGGWVNLVERAKVIRNAVEMQKIKFSTSTGNKFRESSSTFFLYFYISRCSSLLLIESLVNNNMTMTMSGFSIKYPAR